MRKCWHTTLAALCCMTVQVKVKVPPKWVVTLTPPQPLPPPPTSSFWFKLGAPCCSVGCKQPTVCIKGKGEVLAFKVAAAFPFAEGFVEGPICACCFLQCFPNAGCAKPPPAGKATGGAPVEAVADAQLDTEMMDRA